MNNQRTFFTDCEYIREMVSKSSLMIQDPIQREHWERMVRISKKLDDLDGLMTGNITYEDFERAWA